MSPYMAKIVGQEDFVYVWTLGAEGVGDEQDKLVTIDVNPASKQYGKGRRTRCPSADGTRRITRVSPTIDAISGRRASTPTRSSSSTSTANPAKPTLHEDHRRLREDQRRCRRDRTRTTPSPAA